MIRLTVNPLAVQFALNQIPNEHAAAFLDAFTEALVRTGQDPTRYYSQAAVGPDAAPEQIMAAAPGAANPSYPNGDWARLVHPQVLAQITVDLAERAGLPVPDNVFVYDNGDWQRLTTVQPSAPPAPVPLPIQPQPVQAPPMQTQPMMPPLQPAADPYPQPEPISASTYVPPAAIQLAPEDGIEDAQFAPSAPPAAAGLQTGQMTSLPVQAPQSAEQPATLGTGEYGLPAPTLAASKGASPFDKDPGGDVPKALPPRQLRDVVEMLPHLFAAPAGDVVGKGNGVLQRQRMYLAALYLVDTALASVPDPNCPVGYLRYHLSHLRYHASQSPGGPTMLAFEKWLATTTGEGA